MGALVAPASSSASSLVRSQKKEKPFFAECVRRIVDGSDNTGKYSRWHRPSICFSSSINWGKRGPHFRNDSLFGEEERKHKNVRDAPHLTKQTSTRLCVSERVRSLRFREFATTESNVSARNKQTSSRIISRVHRCIHSSVRHLPRSRARVGANFAQTIVV